MAEHEQRQYLCHFGSSAWIHCYRTTRDILFVEILFLFYSVYVLFCKDDQNVLTDRVRAILDWQFYHAGTVGEDLMSLLAFGVCATHCDTVYVACTGISPSVRRAHQRSLIEYYHQQLTAACRRQHINNPFTVDMVVDSCERILPYTLALWCAVNIPFLATDHPRAADFLWVAYEGMIEDVIALKRAGKLW